MKAFTKIEAQTITIIDWAKPLDTPKPFQNKIYEFKKFF